MKDENQKDAMFKRAPESLSSSLNDTTHETNAYSIQDNAEGAILCCNVSVSCKEKGFILR